MFSEIVYLLQLRQILKCQFRKNDFHMLCKMGFHSRGKFVGERVFRKHVADFVELLSGAFCFFENQLILSVFRIFVEGIRTVISGTEYACGRDGIIQRMEQVEAREIAKLLFGLSGILSIF